MNSIEELEAKLKSFYRMAASGVWVETEKYFKMVETNKRQAELLERCKNYLRVGVLSTGQHVKQLDGSVKWERVPTVAAEILKDLEALGEE